MHKGRLLPTMIALLFLASAALPTLAAEDDETTPTTGNTPPSSSEDRRGDDEDQAEDESEDEDEDETDDDEDRRKVEVSVGDGGVEIKLERESAASEDKIEAQFQFEEAEFEVKYEAEANGNESELKLQAQFIELLEYRDGNGNGRYDAGEAIVSSWDLSESSDDESGGEDSDVAGLVEWGRATVSDATAGNAVGKKIVATARLGDTGGEFQLVMYVFGDFAMVDNASLRPTSIKIDVLVQQYPYGANDTALALLLQTESKSETESEHDHDELDADEEGIAANQDVAGQSVSLVFAWKDNAMVDGNSTPVGFTSLKVRDETDDQGQERKELFALSYARGDLIVHDPETFVSIASASGGSQVPAPALLVGVLAMAVAAGWTASVFRRRGQ